MALNIEQPRKVGGRAEAELSVDNAKLTQALHGEHYEDALAGRVFSQAATPLGLAIPIYTGTALAGAMPVWNPSNSNVNVELISATIAYGSGTAAFTAVGLMHRKGLGAGIATGSEITAFAETTPKNGLLGSGFTSAVLSSNAGAVTVTAGVAGEWVETMFGVNIEAQAGTAHPTVKTVYEFNGTIIVPPGSMVWLAGTKASVALYASTIVWKEIPV